MALDLSKYKGPNPFMPTGPTAQTPTSPFPAPAGTYGPAKPMTLDFSGYQAPSSISIGGMNIPMSTATPTPAAPAAKPMMSATPTVAQAPQQPVYSQPNADGSFSAGAVMPPVGSAQYNALIQPKNFSLYSDTTTYPSTAINTGTTRADVLNVRSNLERDMMSGANPNLVPSDMNLQSIAGGVFANSKYTPEEIAIMNRVADTKSKITETSLAERRKIAQLLEDGSISPAQAKAFGQEEARRYAMELADLTASETGDTNRLAVLAALRGNNLSAYEKLAGFFKPQEVTPGSQLVDQFGNQVGQGTGVSPATAASYASQLFNDDMIAGRAQLTPQGQVDTAYYYAQAQARLSGQNFQQGGTPTAMGSMGGSSAAAPVPIQSAMGYINNIPYIDVGNLAANQLPLAQAYSAQSGIPLLSKEDATRLKEANGVFNSADALVSTLESTAQKVITSSSTLGAAADWAKIKWGSLTRSNPDAQIFEQTRDAFLAQLSRATGEKGVLTDQDVQRIKNAVPTSYETMDTAAAKIAQLRQVYNDIKAGAINAYIGSKSPSGKMGGGMTGGTIIQTSAGPVNTDW